MAKLFETCTAKLNSVFFFFLQVPFNCVTICARDEILMVSRRREDKL